MRNFELPNIQTFVRTRAIRMRPTTLLAPIARRRQRRWKSSSMKWPVRREMKMAPKLALYFHPVVLRQHKHSTRKEFLANLYFDQDFALEAAANCYYALYESSNTDTFLFADTEESEGSSFDPELGKADYWTCIKCKNKQNNPLYRYCEKCYQVSN